MNQYESILILPERLKEEAVDQALDGVKAQVKKLGGEVSGATRMGRRSFARPMKKQTAGEYAFMHFRLDPSKVTELHAALRHNDEVFRMQVIRVDGRAPAEPKSEAEAGSEEARD